MDRSALILGGSPWQLDLIRRVRELGYRTIVADISADAPGRQIADQFANVDTNDRQTLLQLAQAECATLVLSDQSDRVVATVGYLNTVLGLRGINEATALRFTNKLLMRDGLVGCDVAMPAYCEVANVDQALDWAALQGYPLVLKPKQSWASLGVKKVDTASQLHREFPLSMQQSRDGKLLVEEYIGGLEVTVEGFSLGGVYTPLAISEKQHYAASPCVARRLAYPPQLPDAAIEQIRLAAARTVNGLGLHDGISHAEFKLRGDVPYLMEVAARGGGNRISSLIVPHICGFDLYELWLNRLCGAAVNLPDPRERAAILQFFSFAAGTVAAVRGLDQVEREGLACQLELPLEAGDEIEAPDSDRTRVGFFIVLGENRDEVDAKAARIEQLVQVEYAEPRPSTQTAEVCA